VNGENEKEVSISPNAYNPYQIRPGPFVPGGPKLRKTTVLPAQIPPTSRCTGKGLFKTIDEVFRALNATNPDLT
jgi:hypothetical protein